MEIEKLYFVRTITASFITTNIEEFIKRCEGSATVLATKEIDLKHLDKWNWVEIYNNYSKKR